MISDKVKDILLDKMTIIKQSNNKDICLVGPVKLPVQLDDQDSYISMVYMASA